MITHKNGIHSIQFPDSIKKTLERLIELYPVNKSDIPELPSYIHIESETLPNTYAICSKQDFFNFVEQIKNNIDLISLNDFLKKHKFNTYNFSI